MANRVENLDRLKRRALSVLPAQAVQQLKKAHNTNADEFMGLVRQAIPEGDDRRDPHLIETLKKEDAAGSTTGVAVSIGGPEAPYPLHLEGGHRTASGSHVPAKPAWNPARQVIRKRAKSRSARAMNAAVKTASNAT